MFLQLGISKGKLLSLFIYSQPIFCLLDEGVSLECTLNQKQLLSKLSYVVYRKRSIK